MIPPRQPLSRRTALATGLGAAGLAAVTGAGCSVRVPGRESPTTSPTPRAGRLEPDVQIVVHLVDAMQRSVALLQATRARHPKLAPMLAPLLAVQKRHLAVLRQAAPTGSLTSPRPSPVVVPTLAPRALDKALERTRGLRDACNSSAGRAESGKFARLLAGMGAALSQQLVVAKPASRQVAG